MSEATWATQLAHGSAIEKRNLLKGGEMGRDIKLRKPMIVIGAITIATAQLKKIVPSETDPERKSRYGAQIMVAEIVTARGSAIG